MNVTCRISKRFEFSASHVLDGLPEGHQCGRLHGHNYAVEVELSGNPDERGMVFDYGDLAPFKAMLDERFDHRHLNDVMRRVNPTAENLGQVLLVAARQMFGDLVTAVRVYETPKTCAEVRVA